MRKCWGPMAGLVGMIFLASCQTTADPADSRFGYAAFDPRTANVLVAADTQSETAPDGDGPDSALAERGALGFRQSSTQPLRHTARAVSLDAIEFSFRNAQISEVVDTVFGGLLSEAFLIHPEVRGQITISTAGSVDRSAAIDLLDRALRLTGAMVSEQSDGSWLISPVRPNSQTSRSPRMAGGTISPGGGVVIVPLDNIRAVDMTQLLQPYARNGGLVQADNNWNVLVLAGDESVLAAMLDMVELFDVDWLDGHSVALYPLSSVLPETMIAELYAVMGGRDSPASGQIEFVALNRLRAIVVITPNASRLDAVEAWLARLDRPPLNEREVRERGLTHADASAVAQHLADLFETGNGNGQSAITIRADESSNSVLIAADARGQERVEAVLRQVDRAPDQVLIEALIRGRIVATAYSAGVQWFLDTRDGGSTTSTSSQSGSVSPSFPGFSYTYASDYVRAAVNAISSLTEVQTLSSPQIVVRNNSSATVQVGDQVPIVTQSAVSVADPDAPIVNSIQFRDTGVVLTVTARIDPAGLVGLDVIQEVSSVAATTTSGIDSPTIQQRRLESSVSLFDGETVVLGGLIRSQDTRSQSGVPGLQRVPGLGRLFRDQSDNSRRTELLVFLTPRVMRSREDAIEVTQDLRDRMARLGARRARSDDD